MTEEIIKAYNNGEKIRRISYPKFPEGAWICKYNEIECINENSWVTDFISFTLFPSKWEIVKD